MPSLNGGGGVSTRCVFCAATAAASKATPDSTAIPLRTAKLHRPLHLAQPHRLEELQPLADNFGEVEGDGLTDGRVRGEVRVERLAGEGNHFRFEGCSAG